LGRLLAMGAPDKHCSLSGAPPRHPTVRVRSRSTVGGLVLLRHRTVRCPSDFCAALLIWQSRPLRAGSICSAGSPDSPVNYSGARLLFPESGWLTPVWSWCTGQSGAPIFSTLKFFALFQIESLT
jgi:hypothetical protein